MILKKKNIIFNLLHKYSIWRLNCIDNAQVKQIEQQIFTKLFAIAIKYFASKYGITVSISDEQLENVANELYQALYEFRTDVFTFIKDNTNE